MRDVVKRDQNTPQIVAAHDHEATNPSMQTSFGVSSHSRRALRNWLLLANVIAWIAIIALIRWLLS